jgi:hypothetical protein
MKPLVQTPIPPKKEKRKQARCWWLKLVFLATQEAVIRRIVLQSQPRQMIHKTLSGKNPSQKWAGGGVTQSVGPDFKPQ